MRKVQINSKEFRGGRGYFLIWGKYRSMEEVLLKLRYDIKVLFAYKGTENN